MKIVYGNRRRFVGQFVATSIEICSFLCELKVSSYQSWNSFPILSHTIPCLFTNLDKLNNKRVHILATVINNNNLLLEMRENKISWRTSLSLFPPRRQQTKLKKNKRKKRSSFRGTTGTVGPPTAKTPEKKK